MKDVRQVSFKRRQESNTRKKSIVTTSTWTYRQLHQADLRRHVLCRLPVRLCRLCQAHGLYPYSLAVSFSIVLILLLTLQLSFVLGWQPRCDGCCWCLMCGGPAGPLLPYFFPVLRRFTFDDVILCLILLYEWELHLKVEFIPSRWPLMDDGLHNPTNLHQRSFNTTNRGQMHNPKSLALLGIALLNNATHGFSCTTLPPSARIRPPSSIAKQPVTQMKHSNIHNTLSQRGGALSASTSEGHDLNLTAGKVIASAWGTLGVGYILLKAIRRVLPIALEPFGKESVALSQFQLGWVLLVGRWVILAILIQDRYIQWQSALCFLSLLDTIFDYFIVTLIPPVWRERCISICCALR